MDPLLQQLLTKFGVMLPGVTMPDAPQPSPEQSVLRDELAKREQAKDPAWKQMGQKVMTAPAEMLSGLFYDPTTPLTEDQRNPAFAVGALGAAFPFAPKGIKGMYSKAEKLISGLPEMVQPSKLNSLLRSGPSTEEVKWRGLDKFLGSKKPVPKADLVKTLEENPLDVKLTRHGERRPGIKEDADINDYIPA